MMWFSGLGTTVAVLGGCLDSILKFSSNPDDSMIHLVRC